MKTKLLGVVAALALFATANSAARADAIGTGDFGPTAVLTDLNNLGNFAAFNAPLTVGIYTFTTDDRLLRYALSAWVTRLPLAITQTSASSTSQ